MDKKTLLAIVLSTIVLVAGLYLQTIVFAPDAKTSEATGETLTGQEENSGIDATGEISESEEVFTDSDSLSFSVAAKQGSVRDIIYAQQNFMRVIMSTQGGGIRQVELLSHLDGGEPLKFFFGDNSAGGLQMRLGGVDGIMLDPVFNYREGSQDNSFEFYQSIVLPDYEDEPFELIKRYRFYPGEYLFELEIELSNSVNKILPLNFNGNSYTLSIGPQIGPEFVSLSQNQRTDYRKFSYLNGNKRKDLRNLSDNEVRNLDERTSWAAVSGKYFVAAALPGNTGAQIVFAATPTQSGVQGNQLYLVRPRIESSKITDTYRFYFGPKAAADLRKYQNAEDNALGIREIQLDTLIQSSWLGWLENGLKWIMNLFYQVIPNWGVSIILLTILVKLVLYPLTRKSYESTAKMKEMQPKINAIKEQYGNDLENKEKLNKATLELYKKEKINPLGGCLPMLLQFPFFIAMYSLFNNHFDLRGATFIPGWITDLSTPEFIVQFGFSIPLVNWDALRLLPILFLGTQLLSMKLTQAPDTGQSNSQMKMMTLGMPIMFFFIMYNMPSGLLVYWIFQNLITTGQQLLYNYFTHKKNTAKAQERRS